MIFNGGKKNMWVTLKEAFLKEKENIFFLMEINM
jgi:hypothetical protein